MLYKSRRTYRSAVQGAAMDQMLGSGVRPGPTVSQDVFAGHAAVTAGEIPQTVV